MVGGPHRCPGGSLLPSLTPKPRQSHVLSTKAAITNATETSWLPGSPLYPPLPVPSSLLWATSGSHAAPCAWHFISPWATVMRSFFLPRCLPGCRARSPQRRPGYSAWYPCPLGPGGGRRTCVQQASLRCTHTYVYADVLRHTQTHLAHLFQEALTKWQVLGGRRGVEMAGAVGTESHLTKVRRQPVEHGRRAYGQVPGVFPQGQKGEMCPYQEGKGAETTSVPERSRQRRSSRLNE